MISVIISAHDRKNYLLDAIKSVVNQTLDKESYEIIVVKNFRDDTIDDYINANGVLSIFTNEASLSGKLIEGLKLSKGDIISFLDDDDMFFPKKLEKVNGEFKKYHSVYVHNGIQAINDKGDFIEFMDNKVSFNMSSISVRKEIINTEILKATRYNIDMVIYAFAVESDGIIFDLDDILTYYRIHDSITHRFANLEDYKIFYTNSLERSLEAYKNIYPFFSNNKVKSLILHEMIFIKIRLKIFSSQKVTLGEYMKFLFGKRLMKISLYEYKLLLASILLKKTIVRRLYNNEIRKINNITDLGNTGDN